MVREGHERKSLGRILYVDIVYTKSGDEFPRLTTPPIQMALVLQGIVLKNYKDCQTEGRTVTVSSWLWGCTVYSTCPVGQGK